MKGLPAAFQGTDTVLWDSDVSFFLSGIRELNLHKGSSSFLTELASSFDP